MKTVWWILGVVGIVALLTGIVLFDGSQQQAAVTVPAEVATINDADWVDGPSNARVTIIEYGDFQCPACAYYSPLVRQLRTEYPNDLRLVARQFPLKGIHGQAHEAARVSEAAGNQGKFWAMFDLLYDRQSEWTNADDASQRFASYARELGLDEATFSADVNADAVKDAIADDIQSGTDAGVNSTPTFILNGTKIPNPDDYAEFKALIDAELQ